MPINLITTIATLALLSMAIPNDSNMERSLQMQFGQHYHYSSVNDAKLQSQFYFQLQSQANNAARLFGKPKSGRDIAGISNFLPETKAIILPFSCLDTNLNGYISCMSAFLEQFFFADIKQTCVCLCDLPYRWSND